MGKGIFEENCHVIFCGNTNEAVVVDPGCFTKSEVEEILLAVSNARWKVRHIVNTHGHLDHIAGNTALKEATGASIIAHANDAAMLTNRDLNGSAVFGFQIQSPPADRLVSDGEKIIFGKCELIVRHTPGHTRGGICLVGPGVVFSGDTLLSRSIGRTDLPGGSLEEELQSIREKLLVLPDETIVYSGHGCTTTIGDEKRFNSFLR
jgi:glyoxylase-like metal-dependent hydrolase (beta-lactamase superfamily II)